MMLELAVKRSRGRFVLDVELSLPRSTVGVFGPSGSGKSTLLHLIAGLIRPDSGRIALDGEVICDTEAGIWTPPHRRGIGIVFQDSRLFPHYTVEGNLRYGMKLLSRNKRRVDFDAVVEVLELESLLDQPGGRISGGERQRVALGRALLASPRLLLLDEPLASLDRGLRSQILVFLRRVRDAFEIPMLHVSHDLTEILQLTDDLVLLEDGNRVAGGKLLEVVRDRRALELMSDPGPVNALRAVVKAADAAEGITELAVAGTDVVFKGTWIDAPAGAGMLLLLRPLDLGLTTEKASGVSFQNQLPGKVVEVIASGSHYLVLIDVGTVVMAEVTRSAARDLALEPGRELWCLFKAQALKVLPA